MNRTRCKVKLVSLREACSNGVSLSFQTVTGNSEENRCFYAANPSGILEFSVSKAAKMALGLEVTAIGAEFYVDFIPLGE